FVVEHPEELREQAYRKAFEEAKKRGERLAKLAGAHLGHVVTIDEEGDGMVTHVYYGAQTTDNHRTRLSSSKLIDIPVTVTLRVRFALHDTNAEKGSGSNARQ
ncbi:MAG: SIMPL domain-containing protein, partial [Pirellulales bacterium]